MDLEIRGFLITWLQADDWLLYIYFPVRRTHVRILKTVPHTHVLEHTFLF